MLTGEIRGQVLLMVSGIGPARALRALGIAVVLDAPEVGANLQEHPGCGLEFALHLA
jgi:choline dehydrogenase-like flavoprotein